MEHSESVYICYIWLNCYSVTGVLLITVPLVGGVQQQWLTISLEDRHQTSKVSGQQGQKQKLISDRFSGED